MPSPEELSPEELQAAADEIDWYHRIDLGHGVVTNGQSNVPIEPSFFPDFAGCRVLDIGAWDGKYSFHAEKCGAASVCALDHYAWEVDFIPRNEWYRWRLSCKDYPDPSEDWKRFRNPARPGMAGFNFAHRRFDSKVTACVDDFMTMHLSTLEGPFDIVLFLGVLYHMDDPLNALRRVRQLTADGGTVVIESLAVEFRDIPNDMSAVKFHPGDMDPDPDNFDFTVTWIPTEAALFRLLRAAGFTKIKRVSADIPVLAPTRKTAMGRSWNAFNRWRGRTQPFEEYRIVLHATKEATKA